MFKPPERLQGLLLPASAAITVAVFVLDLSVPLGVAVWGLYPIPLVLLSWTPHRHAPLVFALIGSVLVAVGALYSPPGPVPVKYAIFNRSVAVGTLWILAVALTKRH
ncbi:hypothetical protein [Nitrospira sp. Kam-Ns4a]